VPQCHPNHHLTKEKRARGNQKQHQGRNVTTNAHAYKIYQAEPRRDKANKKIIGSEMKHIRALLIPRGVVQ